MEGHLDEGENGIKCGEGKHRDWRKGEKKMRKGLRGRGRGEGIRGRGKGTEGRDQGERIRRKWGGEKVGIRGPVLPILPITVVKQGECPWLRRHNDDSKCLRIPFPNGRIRGGGGGGGGEIGEWVGGSGRGREGRVCRSGWMDRRK